MVSKVRVVRIAERIRQELADLMRRSANDPRLVGITISDVTVDRELNYAEIFVSAIEGSIRSDEILAGLEHAQGFLRSELAQRIELRRFPRLRFHWDATFEKAERIDRLIAQLHREQRKLDDVDSKTDVSS